MSVSKVFKTLFVYPIYIEIGAEDVAEQVLSQNDRVVRLLADGRIGYYGLFLDGSGCLAAKQFKRDTLRYLLDYSGLLGEDVITARTVYTDNIADISVIAFTDNQVQLQISRLLWEGLITVGITTADGVHHSLSIRLIPADE